MSKLLFADIETTGFSREWDNILEIAGIIVDDSTWEILSTFHEYIKPNKSIPTKITEITGISETTVANARPEKEVLLSFLEWVAVKKPDTVIGHNYKTFDGQFFDTRAEKFGLKPFNLPIIDTLEVARQKKIPVNMKTATGKPSYTQSSLAEYYGIVFQAHSAIEDVKALIQIYRKMTSVESDIKNVRKTLGF